MRHSQISALAVFSIAFCASAPGAGQTSARTKATAPAHTSLTCEDVIKLAKAGLAEDIIIEQIKKNGRAFDLSTDQLVALKGANVSDRVVKMMLDPSKAVEAPAPAPVSRIAAAPPPPEPAAAIPSPHTRHASSEAESRVSRAALPDEAGVYVKKHGEWIEVPPEIVYWKTGGVLKTVATVGMRHGDVNGHIAGAASHTHLEGQLEFLIVAPEGTALTEYQLLRLRRNKDNREFRTVTGGFFHAESGAQRDNVQFDGKKVAAHTYEIGFPKDTGTGEYGFLPPGSNSGNGKIYSFHAGE